MHNKFLLITVLFNIFIVIFSYDIAYGQEREESISIPLPKLGTSDSVQNNISSPQDVPPITKNSSFPSLFFTYWQHEAILDAKSSRGHVRPPTEAELKAMENGEESLIEKPDPGPREISLGGIVYEGENNWTIWLNDKRITPKAIPKEILDLRVFKEYIEVKWLDEFSSQIFPIRLRAHERFNLDMRIFLPG